MTALFQGNFKMQVHVHTDAEIPDSLGVPPSSSIPFHLMFFGSLFLMPLILPEWTLLNLKASFAVCKSINSEFVICRPALSPELKTCWTGSVWDVQRPCPPLSSSLIIVLLNSKQYRNEPHQCSWGSLIHLLPSLSWKITMLDRLWSVKITLCWADRLRCGEAGQLWAAGTSPLLSHPSFLPSAQDPTPASYVQTLHLLNPCLYLCLAVAPHWTDPDYRNSFLINWWSFCLQFCCL